ncbi:MAG: pseudouridine-5'-phosphate glycosidase [Leptolinea sp.]|nr:pseudouridine-5'-phosphate glycosidase [Leptolinea sp.]
MDSQSNTFKITPEISAAIKNMNPVVALESTVITHGLPVPQNLELARNMEQIVNEGNALPATIAVLDGQVHIGLEDAELENLASSRDSHKISARDFGPAAAHRWNGGTTVAATLIACRMSGIRVFATGGIGGVHRGSNFDVSSDLIELGRSQVIVVCAGAKSILDLPATLEVLETQGVPVVGFGVDEFPAFYSTSSGLRLESRVDTAEEVALIAKAHWKTGLKSAVLVVAPPPPADAISPQVVEAWISRAEKDARLANVHGNAVTPFLLSRLAEISGNSTLKTNLSLLKNNAAIAAQIACALFPEKKLVV